MLTNSLDEVLATLVVAFIYLTVVRFLDFNEREPAWSLLLVFVLGGAGAGALNLAINPLTLNLDTWQGAALRELALFVALAVAFRILFEIGRLRGWSEVTDLVDGLIYGLAAGLGFTCGEVIANLDTAGPAVLTGVSAFTAIGPTALAGLAQGTFGAVLGAGLGLALTRRTRFRWVWPFVGLLAAILVHGAYDVLAYGNALGGMEAVWRGRVALALPVVAVMALGVHGLFAERRVILSQLAGEVTNAHVTAAELTLLGTFGRRQLRYLGALLSGRLADLRWLPALHNRQVMLAFAKRRLDAAKDEGERHAAAAEVDALRRDIFAVRARLDAGQRRPAGGAR